MCSIWWEHVAIVASRAHRLLQLSSYKHNPLPEHIRMYYVYVIHIIYRRSRQFCHVKSLILQTQNNCCKSTKDQNSIFYGQNKTVKYYENAGMVFFLLLYLQICLLPRISSFILRSRYTCYVCVLVHIENRSPNTFRSSKYFEMSFL